LFINFHLAFLRADDSMQPVAGNTQLVALRPAAGAGSDNTR
jgi:hypothetical protein